MAALKLCRFEMPASPPRAGLLQEDGRVVDLTAGGVPTLTALLDDERMMPRLEALARAGLPAHAPGAVKLLSPVERQEVWAAGVTYLRSKKARMEESEFSASAYDLVYDAPRPEIFFKSLPEKVAGPGQAVGIRKDAAWNVPE